MKPGTATARQLADAHQMMVWRLLHLDPWKVAAECRVEVMPDGALVLTATAHVQAADLPWNTPETQVGRRGWTSVGRLAGRSPGVLPGTE
jgi:hypothetical protein